MSLLLVVIARGAGLEGQVADDRHDDAGELVFTRWGREVVRVRPQERYVVRSLPGGRLPVDDLRPTVACAG